MSGSPNGAFWSRICGSALAAEQLVVVYQPIFAGVTCEPTGFEALVRWPHPTRGDISPEEFISVAEESDLIVQLGHWVHADGVRRGDALAGIAAPGGQSLAETVSPGGSALAGSPPSWPTPACRRSG